MPLGHWPPATTCPIKPITSFSRSRLFSVWPGRSHVRVFARHRRVKDVTLTAYASHPASLRPRPDIHVQPFDRFDEILYLVENASDLTLTDWRPLLRPCSKEERPTTSMPAPSAPAQSGCHGRCK